MGLSPTVAAVHAIPSTATSFDTQAAEDASRIEEFLTGMVLASLTEINNQSSITPLTSLDSPTALTWNRLEAACLSCDQYKLLHKTVQSGASDKREDWDEQIAEYFRHRQSLVTGTGGYAA